MFQVLAESVRMPRLRRQKSSWLIDACCRLKAGFVWQTALLATLSFGLLAAPLAAGVDAGLAASRQGDFVSAHRHFLRAAKLGNHVAEYDLGVLLLDGRGIDPDPAQARRWFRRAAEGGVPLAQLNYGLMCLRGDGGPIDRPEAWRWLYAAADHGSVSAQANLGLMLVRGDGPVVDDQSALVWLALAANQLEPGARREALVRVCALVAARMDAAAIIAADRQVRQWRPRARRWPPEN